MAWTVYLDECPIILSEELRQEFSLCQGQQITKDVAEKIWQRMFERGEFQGNAQFILTDDSRFW